MITREIEILGDAKCEYLCVLNALDTEKGREIVEEMLEWLVPALYKVHVVWHDGSRFEYEGMCQLKNLANSFSYHEPVLYLHTKGACNKPVLSRRVRNMWREEFGTDRRHFYFRIARCSKGVACPFSGQDRLTRYNGFMASGYALKRLKVIETSDRMWYEKMWGSDIEYWDVPVVALKYHGSLKGMHRILEEEYER